MQAATHDNDTSLRGDYQLRGLPTTTFVRVARLAIAAVAAGYNVEVERVEDLKLVVDELISMHMGANPESEIELKISTSEQSVSIEVQSEGKEPLMPDSISANILDVLTNTCALDHSGDQRVSRATVAVSV